MFELATMELIGMSEKIITSFTSSLISWYCRVD